jgi:hypothetical protein
MGKSTISMAIFKLPEGKSMVTSTKNSSLSMESTGHLRFGAKELVVCTAAKA